MPNPVYTIMYEDRGQNTHERPQSRVPASVEDPTQGKELIQALYEKAVAEGLHNPQVWLFMAVFP